MSNQNPFEEWLKGQVNQAPIPDAEHFWKQTKKSIKVSRWKKITFVSMVLTIFSIVFLVAHLKQDNKVENYKEITKSLSIENTKNESHTIKPILLNTSKKENILTKTNHLDRNKNPLSANEEASQLSKSKMISTKSHNSNIENIDLENTKINLPKKYWLHTGINEKDKSIDTKSYFIPDILDNIKHRTRWIPYLTIQGGIQTNDFSRNYYSVELVASYVIIPNWTLNIGIEVGTLHGINYEEEFSQIDYGFYVDEKNYFAKYEQIILLNIPIGISYYLRRNTFSGYFISSYATNAQAKVYQQETNTAETGWGYTENFNRILFSTGWSYEYTISKNWNIGIQYTYGFSNIHTIENNTRLQGVQLKVKRWW